MKCHSIVEAVNKGPSPFMKAGPERSPPASGNNAIHAVGDTKVKNKRSTNAPPASGNNAIHKVCTPESANRSDKRGATVPGRSPMRSGRFAGPLGVIWFNSSGPHGAGGWTGPHGANG